MYGLVFIDLRHDPLNVVRQDAHRELAANHERPGAGAEVDGGRTLDVQTGGLHAAHHAHDPIGCQRLLETLADFEMLADRILPREISLR